MDEPCEQCGEFEGHGCRCMEPADDFDRFMCWVGLVASAAFVGAVAWSIWG